MKKIILVLILNVAVVIVSWGQLNPVRNLHWAIYWDPVGQALAYDTLSWNKPIPSLTDTLVGYNIYQSDYLFGFTTDTLNSCSFPTYSSSFCPFLDNDTLYPYWYTHVTAVYNQSHTESTYNDSIYWSRDMIPIGVKEVTNEGLNISSIIQSNSSIVIALNRPVNNGMLIVSNCLGQVIKEIVLQNEQQDINISDLSTGLYLLSLKTNRGNIIRKIMTK